MSLQRRAGLDRLSVHSKNGKPQKVLNFCTQVSMRNVTNSATLTNAGLVFFVVFSSHIVCVVIFILYVLYFVRVLPFGAVNVDMSHRHLLQVN